MKLLAIIAALLIAFQARADLGGCVVYKVKYVLKNGETVTGFLPLHSYDDYAYLDDKTKSNAYCNDKAFQKLINKVFYTELKTLEFTIFKALYLVKFGDSAQQTNSYAFTDSSSVVKMHLDSIKYTIFLSAKNAQWTYPEVGIEIVDQRTSTLMQQGHVFNQTGLGHSAMEEYNGSQYDYYFESYDVLNYNKNISLPELKKKIENLSSQFYAPELQFVKSKSKNKLKKFEQEKQEIVIPIINQLRQEGIILIRHYMAC